MNSGNIFSAPAGPQQDEWFEDILRTKHFRIERIVSTRPSLPEGQWYDQAHAEWVILLQGSAGLRFEDDDRIVVLGPGDHITIPPRRRHRVEWTDPAQSTIWLAVHYP